MPDVLGSAYIQVKPIVGKLSASDTRAVEQGLLPAGAAITAAMGKTGQKAGEALAKGIGQGSEKSNQALGKTKKSIDEVAQRAAAAADASKKFSKEQVEAQEKLITATERHANAVKEFGKDSLQARKAQQQMAEASAKVSEALNKNDEEVGKFTRGLGHAKVIGNTVFSTIAQNSNGALGPLSEIYEKVQGIGDAFKEAEGKVGKAVLGIGSGITAVGATVSVMGSHDQAAEQQLQAAIAGTGKSYEDYKDKIEETIKTGEKYGYTATQTMRALNLLTISTKSPDKALQAFNLTADIAAARHLSLDRAAVRLGQSVNGNTMGLRQFGIIVNNTSNSAKDLTKAETAHKKAVDALAKAQQKLKDKEAELAGGRKSGSGVDPQKIAIDTEKYHLAVNRVADALAKYGSTSSQYQSALIGEQNAQIALRKAESGNAHVVGLSVSQQIALRKAHDAVTAAQAKLTQSNKDLTQAQKNSKDSADSFTQILNQGNKVLGGQAVAATDTWEGHLRVLGARIEDTAASYGNKFGHTLVTVGPMIMGAGAIIETGLIQKFGGAGKAIATWDKEAKIVQRTTKLWTGVQAAFNAVMDANPIMLAVIAVAALAAGFYYAYTHSKKFREFINGLAKDISGAFTTALHWCSKTLSDLWKDITNFWNDVTGWVSGMWKDITSGFMDGVNSVTKTITGWWHATVGFLEKWGPVALAVLAPFIGIPLLIFQHWHQIVGWIDQIWHDVEHYFSVGVDWVKKLVSGWISDEIQGWKNLWHTVTGLVSNLWSDAGSLFDKGIGYIKDHLSSFAKGAINLLPQAGQDIVNGLINGVENMAGHAEDAIKGVGDDIVKGVKDFFGIHSPSTVFAEIGGHLITGLIQGIVKNGAQVPGLLKSVFGDVTHDAAGAMSFLEKQGGGLLNSVLGGGKGLLSKAFGWLTGGGGGGGGTGAGQWDGTVKAALAAAGAPGNWASAIEAIIGHESGGNPNAINLWDSNAKAGHPSQGLMQTIPSTFMAYAGQFAKRGITDPFANIFAGIRYIISRYGSVFNVPGIAAMAAGKGYVGYNAGGSVPGSGNGDTVPALLTPGEFVVRKDGSNLAAAMAFYATAQKFANGGVVTVGRGDTLGGIAARYHTTVSALMELNHIRNPNLIFVGEHLALGDGIGARSAAASKASKAAEAAHKKAEAAAASAAAKRLEMSMQTVSYGESNFTKNLKAATSEIAAQPALYANLHTQMISQAEALVKQANANERATRGTTKHTAALKAQAAALADLKSAESMVNPAVAASQALGQAFNQAAMNGTGLSDLFSYQAGHGALSVTTVINKLNAKMRLYGQFTDVLKQLASKGVPIDMLQDLIQAGPQAGIAIANQLLSQPSAIAQIEQSLANISKETTYWGTLVGQTATSRATAIGTSALAHFGVGGLITGAPSMGDNRIIATTPGEYIIRKPVVDRYGRAFFDAINYGRHAPRPSYPNSGGYDAHRVATAARSGALLSVNGNLILQHEADINKLQQKLYQVDSQQKRATGTGR